MPVCEGFKVVLENGEGDLVSASYHNTVGEITYIPGEWAVPNTGCGPLAVFDNMFNARAYTANTPSWRRLRVFNCRYVLSEKDTMYATYSVNEVRILEKNQFPHGTVLASSLMLTTEVVRDKA